MYSQNMPNGKVRFFESYLDPMTRERKRTSVVMEKNTSATRKKASELLGARIRRLEGRAYEQNHLTLQELAEAYRASRAAVLREQTIASHMWTINGALDVLGRKTVASDLTAGYVLRMFDACPQSAVWKNEKIKRFKTMMRWAYRMDLVGPVDWLQKIPRYEDNVKARREKKYLEPEELAALLERMDVTYHRQLTLFLALTGLRIGEALALRPEDVDLDGRQIHVTKTYVPSLQADGPTKTDGSTRDVYIQSELVPLIEEIHPGTYFFDHGGRLGYDTYRKYLRETSEKAIGRRVTPHVLRHTHTSLLAAQGVPIETISRRLGHQDTKLTLEIYMHVTRQLQERDQIILERAFLTQKLQKSYTN